MIIKKRIIGDVALNFLSLIIPIAILQLITYPIIAKIIPNEYGVVITTYSIIILIGSTLGNVLNNMRLIKELDYNEGNYEGDFNVLKYILICITIILIPIILIIYFNNSFSLSTIVMIMVTAVLTLSNEYNKVAYRLNINFKMILFNAIILSVGYLVGIALFYVTKRWELIFLLGQIFVYIQLLFTTNLYKESKKTTPLFKSTIKDYIFIWVSSFFLQGINYADKLLILPLLGNKIISIYYAASIISKLISMAITPIGGVVLTYLSKKKKVDSSQFKTVIIITFAIALIGYICCVLISKPILYILYPQWVDQAYKLVPLVTIATCIYGVCSIISPFTMKFCNMKWQVFVNGFTFIIYVGASLLLLKFYGIYGFCWGIIISYCVRLTCNLLVYKFLKKE